MIEASIYFITLLRHGESKGNAAGFHQGQSDFPLTQRGVAQSQALAQRWLKEGIDFDRMFSSPLQRARQTAEIISGALNEEVVYDPIWMERDIGRLSGLHPQEAAERYPRPDFVHPYQLIGETGESQWQLYLRAGAAVQSLLRHPPGNYLVISHGGLLNMVFYAILGITPHANFQGPRFRFRNTAFATLTYTPIEHKWAILGVNDRSHWQEEDEETLPAISDNDESEE